MTHLTAGHFADFMEGVHGVRPYPWQDRLVRRVIEDGRWPSVLDLPTGVGKTSALDIALFHLAVDLQEGSLRAPVRIAFIVDRRIVVDDAFGRAEKLQKALRKPPNPVVARVAELLRGLAGPGEEPLVVKALRGGIPRENDWARTPVQPTILCSTVDQVGSRLLFRGYGVTNSMKPVHAGLMGSDCLILLDEAHISEPFRQTLEWVDRYRGPEWRETDTSQPWGVTLLTATPGVVGADPFGLDDADRTHPRLRRILQASKPARLVEGRSRKGVVAKAWKDSPLQGRIHDLASEVRSALAHFRDDEHDADPPAVGVVVNRVARARALFDTLRKSETDIDVVLLIGPARSAERDEVVRSLDPIRTGAARDLEKPLVIVATQTIEVGVDIDLDALITEAAPLDALRQRFGRLNRAGREIKPWAAIVVRKEELKSKYEDPIYDTAIAATWERLQESADSTGEVPVIDFGIEPFDVPLDPECLTRKEDAPVLLPRYVDLLHQTSPPPGADPEVALFLHGVRREPDAVSVVWRADLTVDDPESSTLLSLAPPRAAEAIALPVWAVRKWLTAARRSAVGTPLDTAEDDLADTAGVAPEPEGGVRKGRKAFRWTGSEEGSGWIHARQIRPGDTIVVPARWGGIDDFGWYPQHRDPASDIGARAARPFVGRRWAVRIHPTLVLQALNVKPKDPEAKRLTERLADALAAVQGEGWRSVIEAVVDIGLVNTELGKDLALLESARRGRVECWFDVYPRDDQDRPGGLVLLAPNGVAGIPDQTGEPVTEDDRAGSFTGSPVPIEVHLDAVAKRAETYAARLPKDRVRDISVAGRLHDLGKADVRFQRWLQYGDPLGPDLTDSSRVLAKSGRTLPTLAWESSGLPERWRHEALSVRLATLSSELAQAADPELVLWLIGTHHGYGRPFFPHADPDSDGRRRLGPVLDLPSMLPVGAEPQSLVWEWNDLDWATLAERLKRRYGVWQLAMMETVVRLADHRTSELESRSDT